MNKKILCCFSLLVASCASYPNYYIKDSTITQTSQVVQPPVASYGYGWYPAPVYSWGAPVFPWGATGNYWGGGGASIFIGGGGGCY